MPPDEPQITDRYASLPQSAELAGERVSKTTTMRAPRRDAGDPGGNASRVARSERPRRTALRARRRRHQVAAAPKPRQLPRDRAKPGRRGSGTRSSRVLAVRPSPARLRSGSSSQLFQPFHGSAHGHVTVTIPPHSSASQIGDDPRARRRDLLGLLLRAARDARRRPQRPALGHVPPAAGMSYGDVLKRADHAAARRPR